VASVWRIPETGAASFRMSGQPRVILGDELAQSFLALNQRQLPQVLAVLEQQIENAVGDEIAFLAPSPSAHPFELRHDAALIEQADLAVDNERSTQLLQCLACLQKPRRRVLLLSRQ
jgi:hypothetical protein